MTPPTHRTRDERIASLEAFVQKVAAQRRAICKSDHHAGTCRGAVNLAEEAARVLGGLGIEPRYPQEPLSEPCAICGGSEYVIGEVWTRRWVHTRCWRSRQSLLLPPQTEVLPRTDCQMCGVPAGDPCDCFDPQQERL